MREYDLMIGVLSDRIVAYRPKMARALGGVNCALFFQQIAYQAKDLIPEEQGYSAWVYKSARKMEQETALTRYEQETARRKLRTSGAMEEVRRGQPATMHYRINWGVTFDLLQAVSDCGISTNKIAGEPPASTLQTSDLDGGNPANQYAASPRTKRGSKEGEEIEGQMNAENRVRAREEEQGEGENGYETILWEIAQLPEDRYQRFLGQDLKAGDDRFHLDLEGELYVYDGDGERRHLGRPPRR